MVYSHQNSEKRPTPKEFWVERRMREAREKNTDPALAATSAPSPIADSALASIFEKLDAIVGRFDKIDGARDDARQELDARVNGDKHVQLEIVHLVREIGRAKAELASLRHPGADSDRIDRTTNELDAIVEATETATNTILEAAEEMGGHIEQMRSDPDLDENHAVLLDLLDSRLIRIMEACNFQDITGQRINKIIKTMQFIEERVRAMIDIWGVEAFSHIEVPQEELDEEQALMDGPQLGSPGISQADIDAMFD